MPAMGVQPEEVTTPPRRQQRRLLFRSQLVQLLGLLGEDGLDRGVLEAALPVTLQAHTASEARNNSCPQPFSTAAAFVAALAALSALPANDEGLRHRLERAVRVPPPCTPQGPAMLPKVGRFVQRVDPKLEIQAPEWLCHLLAERSPAGAEPPAQVQGLLGKTRARNTPTMIAGDRLTDAN